jgi:chromosome segregation ATPase
VEVKRMTDKESYRKKMEGRLNQLNAQIADLVDKLETGVDKELESLRPKLKAAREKLDELKQTSADAWGDLKPGMEKAWTELQKSFNEAAARFKTRGRRNN